MEDYNLVPRVKKSIELSIDLATKNKDEIVNSAHLFSGILKNSTDGIKHIFEKHAINIDFLINFLLKDFKKSNPSFFQKKANQKLYFSNEFLTILNKSNDLSNSLNQHFIGVEHILFIILKESKPIISFLLKNQFPIQELLDGINFLLMPSNASNENLQENLNHTENSENKETFLSKYCINLNEYVKKLDYKINGRQEEADKLLEILSCKIKNNAILIGEPGTGKTALVEKIAQKINTYECPIFFSGFKIYSLDLSAMVAGTKYRGQFEERFKKLLDELKEDKQSILFIDEIHSIIGTGSTEGSLDLANMLKPALARGELKCIGATTNSEYKKYFEKDSALNRRFQIINIEEPSKEQTFEILKKTKESYENFHGVYFSDENLKNIINLSEKYIPYKKFPDKAFDILDRVGANCKIKKFQIPQNIREMEKRLLSFIENDSLKKKTNKQKCEAMLDEFISLRNEWIKKTSIETLNINDQNILEIFSKITGLDQQKIKFTDNKSFLVFKENLKSKIFDQEDAIDKIYNTLLCAKAGIKKRKKTIANLLFIGSTGIGKTYMAKTIAENYFDKSNSFLQIDMAEYLDKNSLSKLIGTSAGYVGYEEGGLLSEFVRNNPNSLILFDEVDKAHPDIINILLKIMDEGFIIDSFNRRVDFSNTIIVLTGNIGAEIETAKTMGFSTNLDENSKLFSYQKAIKNYFRPELLARLDEVLIFNNKFSKEGLCKMIDSSIFEIKNTLMEKKIKLNYDNEIKEFLYTLVKKEENNARSVQKILKNKFELPLCQHIVSNENLSEIFPKIVENEITFC